MADTEAESAVYKVALASSDGTMVNRHYGKAGQFFIYAVNDDEGYEFVEERNVIPVCTENGHLESAMQESTARFSDCRYVVASRIGSGACASLSARGITAMELPGSIEEAIVKIWKYNRIQGLFK
ncbi:MAG TPA: dinitrogenase iron-molybdenum cofactor biosynthesis protein [Treponema sp.]|nr:dinitrogenase iron-molybdenum cofactor biosynthesis protein [Treponema sp.]